MPKKFAAVYVRVSSKQQDHRSQLPDLERWAENHDGPVKWFKDKATGKNMDRPAWNDLADAIRTGKVESIVVWRLDRLGRTASGLTALFDDLQRRKINLVSLKDGLDLSTPAGRLMANVLASVAAYDNEVRGERQRAGIEVAKAAGKYRGRKPGTTKAKPSRAKELREQGLTHKEIAQALGVSVMTVSNYMKAGDE